jgi:hypothetical protein
MSDRCSETGQPQKPSPPSTKIFFGLESPEEAWLTGCTGTVAVASTAGARNAATAGRRSPTATRTALQLPTALSSMADSRFGIGSLRRGNEARGDGGASWGQIRAENGSVLLLSFVFGFFC